MSSLDVSHASHTLRQLSRRMRCCCAAITNASNLQKAQLYAVSAKSAEHSQLAAVKTLARPAFSSSAAVQRNAKRITREFVSAHCCSTPERLTAVPASTSSITRALSALRGKISASNYAAPDHSWNKPRFVLYSSRFVRHASSRWRRGWPPATSRASRRTSRATRVSAWSY